jgi:hypothetical protein
LTGLSHEKFLLMMLEKPLSHIDLGGGIRGWLDAYGEAGRFRHRHGSAAFRT